MIYDFKDFSKGPVSAHRHINGGGWVADTAKVEETVYVGPNAQVRDFARVSGTSILKSDSIIGGSAWIDDNYFFGPTHKNFDT